MTVPPPDPVRDSAAHDEIFKFVLDFVDGLPKVFNTVDVAVSRIGETTPLEVVGNITNIPQPVPVPITKQDYELKRSHLLENKTYVFFNMQYKSYTLKCAVHNVPFTSQTSDFPYGKSDYDYSTTISKLQYAFENGRKITVRGVFVTIMNEKKRERVLYAETVDIEQDALTSLMGEGQFEAFMALCQKYNTNPLKVFMSEIFTTFAADEYLKKMVAVFCLSPKSREEMFHMLLLTSPGEGKDYLIDKIIRPMVICGKVEGNHATTAISLVGAMSSNDLNSVGIGTFTRYHHERMAVSEVQTWNADKFEIILGMMANGEVSRSVGNIQIQRPATENLLMAGNIDNTWKAGNDPMAKLGAIFSGKNKQYAKQLMSRFTLVIAKPELTKLDPAVKARMMYANIDKNSATKEGDIFIGDDEIKRICSTVKDNCQKSDAIRKRKIDLLRTRARMADDNKIVAMMRQMAFQEFFGQYFKYVSLMNVEIYPVESVMTQTLLAMTRRDEFKVMMCNVSGNLDARKIQEFSNLCKCFAKIHGHTQIEKEDISQAETLFKESISTLIQDFGASFLTTSLDMVEMEMLKFIGEKGSVTEDEIKSHLKTEGSLEARFFNKNMDAIQPYVVKVKDRYLIGDMPDGLKKDLGITSSGTIVEKDAQIRGVPMVDDTDLEARLANVDYEGGEEQ